MSNKNMFIALALGLMVFAASAVTVSAATPTIAPLKTNASLTLISPTKGTFDAGQTQTVRWSKTIGSPAKVSVNLIRKTGSNPARYELVRTIAASTANDGSATWVPAATDIGSGLSLEVGCGLSKVACTASKPGATSLAVKNTGKYKNTASAFQSIEASKNK